ncbi:MAG: restriction endonuclease subunit S [Sphaerospermopsis kisseleviana]
MKLWKIAKLNEVANIERMSIQPKQIKDETIYVGLEHIEKGGRFIGLKTVKNGELASSKFQFTKRHILYGKLRPYLAKIACPEFSGICSTDILPILPKSNVDRKFLFHFLRQPKIVDYANSQAVGINLPRLSPSVLTNLEIPLPPLEEQKRIAEILDQAEELRRKRKEAIAQLDTLTQSIFLEMFGDPVVNPKGWEQLPFAELLTNIDSGWSPVCLDHPVSGEEWGVLKLGAVTWCEYDHTQNKALPPNVEPDPNLEVKTGDLLFTRKNTYDLVGACVLVRETPPRLMMSDLIFRFRLRADANVNPCFLHQLLIYPTKRRNIQKLAGGSASSMPNISKAKLQTTLIEVPPLSLQKEFAQRVEAVEELKKSHRASLLELDALFASLQHRAFKGEL